VGFETELFVLQADAKELVNLTSSPAHPVAPAEIGRELSVI
jgi:hypothetical protein